MSYFDYLRLRKLEDTKENFIKYLTDVKDFTKEEAEKESKLYY